MKHRGEIWAIAFPAIVTNITTPILGLVDVAVTGHIGAALYIGAIAVGGAMFNMLYWLFNFLRMGTTGFTAQAFGAEDNERLNLILYRSLIVGLLIGLLMLVLSGPIGSTVLRFMDAADDTQELARRYFEICIWGAPAVLMTYALSGWFLGMQNSKAQMWMAIVTNVVNIAVSIILVFGLGWKIEGVATGTLLAQWIGLATGLTILFVKYRPAIPQLRLIFELRQLMSFFRVNSDIFLRTACLVAVTLWFTHAGALEGTETLAANALLMQLFMLFSFFMDGFAFAGEALTGKYIGRSDDSSLGSLIKTLLLIGLACASIFSLIYLLGGDYIIRLLAKDPRVVGDAIIYLPWAVAVPLCGFLAFVWDGVFVGLVHTRAMLLSMALALIVFFTVYLTANPYLANHGLWLAFNAYLLTRGLILWLLYNRATHHRLNCK